VEQPVSAVLMLGAQLDALLRIRFMTGLVWEKATILHQEAHRSAEKRLPPHYSRHCYDMYFMGCFSSSNVDFLSSVITSPRLRPQQNDEKQSRMENGSFPHAVQGAGIEF